MATREVRIEIGTLAVAVARSIDAQPVEARDDAAAELALKYARAIDDGADLSKVGPALLAALESLGLTPRSRKVVTTGDKPSANPLDQLAERRARQGRADDGHAAASS